MRNNQARIHKDGDGDCLIPAEVGIHYHMHISQSTKTFYNHKIQESWKATRLKTKNSAQTLKSKIFPSKISSLSREIVSKAFKDECKVKQFGQDHQDRKQFLINVEDDGEVLHTVKVEYEWKPPRCGVCMVFEHDDMLCPKQPVEKPKKQHTNHDGFQHTYSYHVSRKVTSSTNPFDALNTIEEGDELGSNGGSSNSGKKVVQDVVGSTSGSLSNTPLVARINDLESQMIEGKLVLLDDDGKSLKPCKSTLPSSSNVVSKKVNDLVNEDNDRKWKSAGRNKSLYEQWKENHGEDPYDDDDFDDPGLTDAQMKFANAFDINLRGQLR
ncbi:hypothetical protein Tco_0428731 [Tanacetum coccineum]